MPRLTPWMLSSLVLATMTMSCVMPQDAATFPTAEAQAAQYQSREARAPRGTIQVTNDWRETVRLSLWSHHREPIGSWELNAGETLALNADGEPIKGRPGYKIKVGEDWGWVNLGEVGEFQRGTWFVNVRSIWAATHRTQRDVPDWKR